jgi:hypothetical protein
MKRVHEWRQNTWEKLNLHKQAKQKEAHADQERKEQQYTRYSLGLVTITTN